MLELTVLFVVLALSAIRFWVFFLVGVCIFFPNKNREGFTGLSDKFRKEHSLTLGSPAALEDINPNPELVHRRRSMDKVSDQ